MPHRRPAASPARPSSRRRQGFRERYNKLEARRTELIARLHSLSDVVQRHPGYKRAFKLLNDTYRREKLAQRMAVLQAASWLISVLEELTPFM
jgi:hypothetical protein